MRMAAKPIYRVVFLNQGKVYEVYARHVSQTGSLFGFVEIEELIFELKKHYTIVIVTHNMQQAARVSDYTGFFLMGELIECDVTTKVFTTPSRKETEDYITGRFG